MSILKIKLNTNNISLIGNNLTKMDDVHGHTNGIESDDGWSLISIVSLISQLVMVFGGVVPYIPQYNEVRKSQNAEGFSLFVCLALLVANILRILFWFGRPFELPLVIQSILMNITMLLMINLCVGVKNRSDIIKKKDKVFTDFDLSYFWNWTDFVSYAEAILVFIIMGAFTMFLFCGSPLFVETVGFLAVFVEACLGVPQFLKNYKNGSTRGMNLTMVCMWTVGDCFKTSYFLLREAPFQFVLCGALQIMVDISILSQVWFYGGNAPTVAYHPV